MLEREQLLAMTPKLMQEHVLGLAVVGSYARGNPTPYSDIDVICLVKPDFVFPKEPRIDLYQGVYRVAQYRSEAQLQEALNLPERAVYDLVGLQQMLILFDPQGVLRKLQLTAQNFTWDSEMNKKADLFLNQEMIAWQEECYKAMAGMHMEQEGRMLLGLYGLTYGLVRLMLVAKGVLLESENDFFEALTNAYSQDIGGSELVDMMGLAFGLDEGFPLLQRVETGLLLYLQFAEYLGERLKPQVQEQVFLVQERLEELLHRAVGGFTIKEGKK